MSIKYQRQIERILKKWAATPATSVGDFAKQDRWPAGAPGSKGGQFAPTQGGGGGKYPGGGKPMKGEEGSGAAKFSSYGSLFGAGSTFPGGQSPKWAAQEAGLDAPKGPPPGAKPHLKTNDKGETVTINYPTKPSDKGSWTDPDRTATFVPGGDAPAVLNGIAMKPWASVPKSDSEWAAVPGQKLSLDARFPFEPTPGKSTGAGVIVREPDGRIWLTKPTNAFGGYQQTFPKGTVEHGLTMQASAIKETWEETGLQIKITGILGDYERTTSKARFYVAERVGGTPKDMGWESQAVRLATRKDLDKLLNMGVDKAILEDLDMEGFFEKAAGPKPPGKYNVNQPRWPAGTPLGGQWKTMDGDGITLPPTLAGGLSGSNSQYQKKANAAYAAAKAGDKKLVLDTAIALEKKVKENAAKGATSSHTKWNAQLSQFVTQLASDIFAAPKAQAIAERLSGLTGLSSLNFLKPKSEGSNPGAHYTDAKGNEWLVKGNANASSTGPMTSDTRAKNEVLAAKLMQAAGVGAPDMKLVDLEGKHGGKTGGPGNLGVASKMIGGLTKFDPNNPAHIAAARADFAVHAWLGNWDVLGASYDNTMIGAGGKAVCIDPGGSIFFRAQGSLKDKNAFGNDAADFETMRSSNHLQKQVYGGMTKSDLQASAAKLAGMTDDTIRQLVKTHAPMASEAANNQLADILIARRDAILAKAGLTKTDTLGDAKNAPAVATPAPAPTPPSVAEANTPAKPVAGLTKPTYDDTFGKAGYYDKLSDQMLAAHAAGDAMLLDALQYKKGSLTKVWPEKGGAPSTVNGKLMAPFHAALVADLEAQKGVAAQALAAGKAALTGSDGKTWVDDGKGVLQPAAATPGSMKLGKDDLLAVHNAAFGEGKPFPKGDQVPLAYMIAAAKKGDTGPIEGTFGLKTKGAQKFKEGLLAAMQAKAAAAPAAPPATKAALTKDDLNAVWSPIKAKHQLSSDVDDYFSPTAGGPVKAMFEHALKGDVAAITAVKVQTEAGKEVKTALLAALGVQASEPAARPAATKPVVTEPQPVPPPAPKVPTGAAPNFDKAMLPATNSNAPSHNAKISQIKALFDAGDEKGILALKLGTNTYAKQQVKVANDALAAMGSVHQVAVGQAANSHIALTGGSAQATSTAAKAPAPAAPAAPKGAAAPKKKPFDPGKITAAPDFKTMGAGGGPLSGVPAINEANNAAVKAIYEAASKGDLEALKNLTFPEVDKGTGQLTGKQVPFSTGAHPSKHVSAYYQNLVNEVDLQLNPPVVTPIGGRVAGADWDGGFGSLKPVASGKAVAAVDKASKAGDYIILGAVKGVPDVAIPAKDNSVVSAQPWKTAAVAAYKAASQKAKDTFSHYVTTSGARALNTALRSGNVNATTGGKSVMQHVQDFKALLVDIPEGSTFVRNMGGSGFGQTPDPIKIKQLQQFLMGAEKGTVIQEPGFSSSSWGKQILGDNDIQWQFTAGKGVKAFPAWLTANTGEGESLFPPNQRYMITGAKKQGKTVVVEAVLLPTID